MNTTASDNNIVTARRTIASSAFDPPLPDHLAATEPPEAHGVPRDGVRLMISRWQSGQISHARFHDIPNYLDEGDLLLVNTSRTIPAALPIRRSDGMMLQLHLSTKLPSGTWVVEIRRPAEVATLPYMEASTAEVFVLPEGGRVTILSPYPADAAERDPHLVAGNSSKTGSRLWIARLEIPGDLDGYLERNGKPIRYGYVPREWPLEYYQTVFAETNGSAEMPSAGRGFTPELVTRLVSRGVGIAPILLHTGVASQESHEAPYAEHFRVSATTARRVNETRQSGGRVIAVGTTAVRAIESATDADAIVHASAGWTDLVIMPKRGLFVVDGILTGLHEPQATHLQMLAAVAPVDHLRDAYREAIDRGYLWHEFGDLHLILP